MDPVNRLYDSIWSTKGSDRYVIGTYNGYDVDSVTTVSYVCMYVSRVLYRPIFVQLVNETGDKSAGVDEGVFVF